ncbi:MAG: hypothetical protein ACYTAF_17535, partial [Planctomycetota bacterium]
GGEEGGGGGGGGGDGGGGGNWDGDGDDGSGNGGWTCNVQVKAHFFFKLKYENGLWKITSLEITTGR